MRQSKKSRRLTGKLAYTGQNTTETHIHYIQYGPDSFFEKKADDINDILSLMDKEKVSWIRVNGMNDPDVIIDLVKKFGLNIMDAKDILTIQHIITLEEYDDNVFIVLPATYHNKENEIVTEHVALILGRNYIISFQETDFPLFEGIYTAIKDNALKINNRKADFLLATLLNEIVANYADCIVQLEDSLEGLEDQLLDIDQLKKNLIGEIQEERREMIRLRKLLLPFKDQLAKLLRVDRSLIGQQEIPYFKDIYDQLLYVLQNIESCREIMSSLVDLYLNNNDLRMNFVMKRLTVVATIFIPLTFLVGVWGMNFDFMPELNWRYGYLFAWVLMLGLGAFGWWYFKKKDLY